MMQKHILKILGLVLGLIPPALVQATGPGEFSGTQAFEYLKKQVAFGPRNPGSPGHQACQQFLVQELGKYADRVEEQSFMYYDAVRKKTLTLTNIIGRINPGVEPRLLLCAHWDTRPMADRDPDPANRNKPIPGANDGASGVAVLLEVARQLSAHPPIIGVDIVFFDGEDYGREGHLEEYFLGSRHFVEVNRSFYPAFAILLDMVGDAHLELPIEGFSNYYAPDIVQKIWGLAGEMGLPQFIPVVGEFVNDDHVVLNDAGIRAIDIIDFNYPDESHRYWHTLKDTPDKCAPESLKAVGDLLLELIYRGDL